MPTSNSYANRQISIPHKIDTHEPIDKKFGTVDYVHERWYYSATQWHVGDVLVGNHRFVIYVVLDVSFAINLTINCSFLHLF